MEKNWDWQLRFPIIHFDFGGGMPKSLAGLKSLIHAIMDRIFSEHDIPSRYEDSTNNRFSFPIDRLHAKYNQQVVIMFDEYDKPILDNITEPSIASQLRDKLKIAPLSI